MWSETERDALQMNLRVHYKARSYKISSKILDVPDFAGCARDLISMDSNFLRRYRKDKAVVYLVDKIIDQLGGNPYLALLLAISDKERPDNVLTDPVNSQRRQINKKYNEGNEYSCHIVISLNPDNAGGNCYRAAFEQVPLFSPQHVHRFVHHVFKEVTMKNQRTVPHPAGVRKNGEYVQIPVSLKTEFSAVPSDDLLRDLRNGVLSGIELSREEPGLRPFDARKFTVDKRSTLLLGLADRLQMPPIMDVIRSVCAKGKNENFTTAKVTWKMDGHSNTARFDCDSASIMESRYIRRHTFRLETPLPASCDRIDVHLARSMMSWIS